MKSSPSPASTAAALFFSIIALSACKTNPVAKPEGEIPPPPAAESATENPEEALNIDWTGTTWIQTVPGARSGDFPGYRGIHLGADGRLLLINMDEALGDRWTVGTGKGGPTLVLTLLSGTPDLPVNGSLFAFPEQEESTDNSAGGAPVVGTIRLAPESSPGSPGIVLRKARVNVDILENHWIPRSLRGDENVMWPVNREIHLMVLPDASGLGVLGFGGENRFRGGVALDEEKFVVRQLAITRKFGPASDFENLYVGMIGETNRYVQVGDDLFFYRDTLPTAAFRVRLFD